MKIVLVTGAAPYIGGPATWRRLRAAAPEFDYIEFDSFAFAALATWDAFLACLERVFNDADAVVAHHSAARAVSEAIGRSGRNIPVVFLSPLIILEDRPLLRSVRVLFGTRMLGGFLTRFAESKLRKLKHDRQLVTKQLRYFVAQSALSDDLIDEAQSQLRDPRCEGIVARTAEFLRYTLLPLAEDFDTLVPHRAFVLGSSASDRRFAKRLKLDPVPGVFGAAMIEAPEAVASALRELVRPETTVSRASDQTRY